LTLAQMLGMAYLFEVLFHKGAAFVRTANEAILSATKVMIRAVQARFLERQSARCQRLQQDLKLWGAAAWDECGS
jgi:hypothetical protein